MRVLHVAAEMFPLVKTGGLADVVGSLPSALSSIGVETAVLLPGYPQILSEIKWSGDGHVVRLPGELHEVGIRPARHDAADIPLLVVESNEWFNRPGLPYGPNSRDAFADNHFRFAAFSAAVPAVARTLWSADVVHAHDWHAGLSGAYLSLEPGAAIPVVYTIHNLAYQGLFDASDMPALGLPDHLRHVDALEFHGLMSFMKAGINFASRITTVSPTYAREIQTVEFGHGLDGLLRHRAAQLQGILNGIDYEVWNPAVDADIRENYTADSLKKRKANRSALLADFNLPDGGEPIVGVVSRLTEQKGLDLLLEVVPPAVEAGISFVILGSGNAELETGFTRLAARYPNRVGVSLDYDEPLSHRIYAGADIVAIPSRFEPCGLTQLFAMRYGALPLARNTGGLADTVIDLDTSSDSGNGFLFERADGTELLECLLRARQTFRDTRRWRRGMKTAMTQNFSWAQAAEAYRGLYTQVSESVN